MKKLKIISLGCGVQSTTLYFMSSRGALPRTDYAIFADPGAESAKTYAYVKYLLEWQRKNDGIPIIVTGKKSIYQDILTGRNGTSKFFPIPAYTVGKDGQEGMLRRACTEEYKIRIVNKAIRKLQGIPSPKRMAPAEVWVGITTDEAQRMRFTQLAWETRVYPFLGYRVDRRDAFRVPEPLRFSRADCINWLTSYSLRIPPKSACIFCPFLGDARWLDMKRNEPEEFERAVILDRAIRDSTGNGVKQPAYLHRSCVPLDQVNFREDQLDLFDNCNSGHCGI